VFVGVLAALSAAAWLTVHRLATPDMRVGILTGAARPGGPGDGMAPMPMSEAMGQAMSGGVFLAVWLVMMAAMMLPAVTPMIVRVDRLMRRRGAAGTVVYALAAGYLTVWGVAGVAAYGLFLAFQAVVSADDPVAAARAGATVLLLAGVYQLTPLKRACLRQCRSPLAVLVHHGEKIMAGPAGALRAGAHHGAFCLGCCWALMAVLLAAGMMSLVWMGVIAAVVLAEKVLRHGESLGRSLGAGLIGLALVLLAEPGLSFSLT
jgi:predicted metal-binding membrane protein